MNIKTDSRKIVEGDTFIAIDGINRSGDDFILDAINRGATTIVAKSGKYSVNTINVEDPKEYLINLVTEEYKNIMDSMLLIGVTGTNGKTTVAYLINESLNKFGVKCASIGTLGYFRGSEKIRDLNNTSPDILTMYDLIRESFDNGYKCVVIEASSQGLYEGRLDGICFDYAIFTNLTHDHLDVHKTFSNYALAKSLLFKKLKVGGKGILNIDDKNYNYFLTRKSIFYGFSECANYHITDYNINGFSFSFNNTSYTASMKLIGKHNVYNMMAVVTLLMDLGFDETNIFPVIGEIDPPSGRMESINYQDNLIVVDYAHTPDAINNILNTVGDFKNIYAVFGCTGNRDKLKRPIMTRELCSKCKTLIITSDDLYYEDFDSIVSDMVDSLEMDNYIICRDRREAIEKGIGLLKCYDALLILGKGHECVLKIGDERIPFNDMEVVKSIIN